MLLFVLIIADNNRAACSYCCVGNFLCLLYDNNSLLRNIAGNNGWTFRLETVLNTFSKLLQTKAKCTKRKVKLLCTDSGSETQLSFWKGNSSQLFDDNNINTVLICSSLPIQLPEIALSTEPVARHATLRVERLRDLPKREVAASTNVSKAQFWF